MSDYQQLSELEDAVLRFVQDSETTYEDILESFTSKVYPKVQVKQIIKALERRSYVQQSEDRYLKSGGYLIDGPTNDNDFEYRYEITALGKAYLARSTTNFTSFSNITNSNIANSSSNTQQLLQLSQYPEDITKKVIELQIAIQEKDASKMTKIFAYIADKSVDAAIAILTGAAFKA